MAALVKGLKRICMSCGMRFYDMGKTPIVCPSCDTQFTGDVKVKIKRARTAAIEEEDQVEEVEADELEEEAGDEGEEVSLEDIDEDDDDDMDEDIALDDDDVDLDDEDLDDLDEEFDEDEEEFEEEEDDK